MITKSQYQDWLSSPVTQEMYESVAITVEDLAANLINSRRSDPLDDQFIKGFIRGVQAGREWEPELVEE